MCRPEHWCWISQSRLIPKYSANFSNSYGTLAFRKKRCVGFGWLNLGRYWPTSGRNKMPEALPLTIRAENHLFAGVTCSHRAMCDWIWWGRLIRSIRLQRLITSYVSTPFFFLDPDAQLASFQPNEGSTDRDHKRFGGSSSFSISTPCGRRRICSADS